MEAARTRLIALTLATCLTLNVTTFADTQLARADEVPPAPTQSSSPSVPVLVALRPTEPEPPHTHREEPDLDARVADLLHRADVAATDGDRRASIAFVHEAERLDRGSRLLRVARIAHVHALLPGLVLGLRAREIDAVLDVHEAANRAHTIGFVAGAAGALAGILGIGALVWGGILYRPVSDEVWTTATGLWVASGVLALAAISFHIEGVVHDGEVEARLQISPTASGASMQLTARF